MQVIKWFDYATFEQTITLGKTPYKLIASWNTRGLFWSIALYTSSDKALLTGKKLTINQDILANIYDIDRPKGVMLAVPVAADASEITRDNMGNDVKLIFVGDDELLL